MVLLLSLLTSAAAVLATPFVAEPRVAQPDPNTFSIRSVSTAGGGCPADSVTISISDDGTEFIVVFDNFKATTDSQADSYEFCLLSLGLFVPEGIAFYITTFASEGHVRLDQGVNASQSAFYYFLNSNGVATGLSSFIGPVDQDFFAVDILNAASYVYSQCGGNTTLYVGNSLEVSKPANSNATGFIAENFSSGQFVVTFQLHFLDCGGASPTSPTPTPDATSDSTPDATATPTDS